MSLSLSRLLSVVSFDSSFVFLQNCSSHSRLPVPSSKLGIPRTKAPKPICKSVASAVECRHRSLLPLLISGMRVQHSVQNLLQNLSSSHATVPLIDRGVGQDEPKAHTHTARRLEAICLKRVLHTSGDEQQPHSTTDQSSSSFSESTVSRKGSQISHFRSQPHLAQRSSPNGSLVHVLR